MEIEIVPGSLDDVAVLGPLWRAMVEHHDEVIGRESPVRDPEQAWEMREQQYRKWLGEDSGVLLLARRPPSGDLVGYAFLRTMPSGPTFDLGAVVGELESLVVAGPARGSGVGTALVEASRTELRGRGCTYWSVNVVEANTGAVALYERAGFRPWRRDMLGRLDG